MTRYENDAGDELIVVEEEYIIFDKQDDNLRCELYDEDNFNRYLESGFRLSKNNPRRVEVGLCPCGNKIYEGNRIKVRDYFKCPKCEEISARNDLYN